MSLASTTIEHFSWGDPRIHRLAKLLGYSDPDFALIKMAKLWARCTYLGTDQPGDIEIQACLDDRGPELLVLSGLGERLEDAVRVKGAIADDGTDRIGWFRHRHPAPNKAAATPQDARSRGGKSRVGAPRAGGRFVKSTTDSAGTSSTSSAGENATSSTSSAGASGSGSGSEERISPARVGGAGENATSSTSSAGPAGGSAGTSSNAGGRVRTRPVLSDIWTYAQRKHLELRPSIDPHSVPWTAMPSGVGVGDLQERIRELEDRGLTDEQIHAIGIHAVDVRAAEAKAFQPPHLRFFIASRMFTPEAFSKASELSPAQAAAQAAQKNSGGGSRQTSRPSDPERRRSEPLKPC